MARRKSSDKLQWLKPALVLVVVFALSGCSKQSHPSPTNPISQPTSLSKPEDGTIVSKKLLDVPENPEANIYKIFYMSAGVKLEAFISEPKRPGKYPLFVSLQGGWAAPVNIRHDSFGFDASSMENTSDTMVTVEPEYRGYKDSDGTVQGLAGDTLDTENAIAAAMSFGNITADSTYLLGYSMGGGVALRVASERHDVKAVVAVSPFVGWDEEIHWMDEHPKVNSPQIVETERTLADKWKQLFAQSPTLEKQNSLLDRISSIQAPVLFLQGTEDPNVVWQTAQERINTRRLDKRSRY